MVDGTMANGQNKIGANLVLTNEGYNPTIVSDGDGNCEKTVENDNREKRRL